MINQHIDFSVTPKFARCTSLGLAAVMAISMLAVSAAASTGAQAADDKPATQQSSTPAKAKTRKASASADEDPGQRKFNENCSRCHSAPESISPRISGTVVRHMRVRASLSAQDERDILRFLAP